MKIDSPVQDCRRYVEYFVTGYVKTMKKTGYLCDQAMQ